MAFALMLSGKAGYPEYPRPLTEWETRCLPLHSVKIPLDSIRMIRIGMNPKGKKLTFWIRNLRLYRNQESPADF